jgi:hypothetical protein
MRYHPTSPEADKVSCRIPIPGDARDETSDPAEEQMQKMPGRGPRRRGRRRQDERSRNTDFGAEHVTLEEEADRQRAGATLVETAPCSHPVTSRSRPARRFQRTPSARGDVDATRLDFDRDLIRVVVEASAPVVRTVVGTDFHGLRDGDLAPFAQVLDWERCGGTEDRTSGDCNGCGGQQDADGATESDHVCTWKLEHEEDEDCTDFKHQPVQPDDEAKDGLSRSHGSPA